MKKEFEKRVGIVFPGDETARSTTTRDNNKLSLLFSEFTKNGIATEPVVYSEKALGEIENQLKNLDAVLVWVNPIENGRNRAMLDNMLLRIAEKGTFVSTHPDIILKMGTKEVLYKTRNMAWGSDVYLYNNVKDLEYNLLLHLADGSSRVLKQSRGNGGNGIWRVELAKKIVSNKKNPFLRIIHALRDSTEEIMLFSEFIKRIEQYFVPSGQIIEQPFFSPIPEGMIRCYMTRNKVVGFGHQHVTALVWPSDSSGPLKPQPRIYHAEDKPEFQDLRVKMETEWIPQLQDILKINSISLPILWDADFLYGPKTVSGTFSYILCEINVSSVHPFPESALSYIVSAVRDTL